MYWSSMPPNSVVRVSLPSLYAPAPPQPQRMPQGLQWRHFVPLVWMGQARAEMSRPFSRMRTFRPVSAISNAAKMPAGPAPMMITS